MVETIKPYIIHKNLFTHFADGEGKGGKTLWVQALVPKNECSRHYLSLSHLVEVLLPIFLLQ